MTNAQVSSMLGDMWRSTSDEEKRYGLGNTKITLMIHFHTLNIHGLKQVVDDKKSLGYDKNVTTKPRYEMK